MRAGLRDRLGLLAAMALLALALGAQAGLGRLDAMFYDAMVSALAPAAGTDTVVVAIDEASLAAHGRWPWDRRVLADLIERIAIDEPSAIALDLLLSEPAGADEDAALAAAMRRSGRVALPVFTAYAPGGGVQAVAPVAELAQAAAALGHVSIETDADGVARSVFLREGNASQGWWDHLAVQMLRLAGAPTPALPGARAPAQSVSPGAWQRDHWVLLTFARGEPPTVSAAAVLAGELEPDVLRGRMVLIGVTAGGLGDTYPTPRSRTAYSPGVYVLATALANLAHGDTGTAAGPLGSVVFTLLVMCLLLPVYWRASPSHALLWTLVVALAACAASALIWLGWRLWYPPAGAVIVCLAAYPVWSWRRLESASAYLDEELTRLRHERALLPARAPAAAAPSGDAVERRIAAMRAATDNLRALNAFIAASIEHLPDAVLVTDGAGQVLLANRAAATYVGATAPHVLAGVSAAVLLDGLRTRDTREPLAPPPAEGTAECIDAHGGEFLYKSAPLWLGDGPALGIVTVVDIARVRQAEQRRDEALRFLSHDLRAPLAAIQALIDGRAAADAREREARVARLAGQALHLAESFVQLARAESAPLRVEVLDLAEVAMDAEDACWAQARELGVSVAGVADVCAEVRGDRSWLTRALVNLLGNAIKFSPRGGQVRITLAASDGEWHLSVSDAGPGVPDAALAQLGQPFVRLQAETAGVGLGLAYVRTVAARHGGHLVPENLPGGGARFTLCLPRAAAPADAPT
ncbi:CHASE2 domain-containing protein [Verticiella sediminum]|uniref:histidine kinase n=1 Tax=Verticiella sediminum TaxID=1247510 RepID=A0A556AIJ9_9BURK|nr:CHASE2 domain-containing protein [Verticiella sediminum]TSH92723.1 CHASE2 domain-containing protein [Verticiella sediminum]